MTRRSLYCFLLGGASSAFLVVILLRQMPLLSKFMLLAIGLLFCIAAESVKGLGQAPKG